MPQKKHKPEEIGAKLRQVPGQSGVISQWVQPRRLTEKANKSGLVRTSSARVIARRAIGDFQSMIRSKTARKLDAWLATAKKSLIGSFAGGVEKNMAAVRSAIISPGSNGQTEGQITRLKLIKRQTYGRAKLDLLQAQLIGAS